MHGLQMNLLGMRALRFELLKQLHQRFLLGIAQACQPAKAEFGCMFHHLRKAYVWTAEELLYPTVAWLPGPWYQHNSNRFGMFPKIASHRFRERGKGTWVRNGIGLHILQICQHYFGVQRLPIS